MAFFKLWVKAGDRIEIYRPITADPATVPRRQIAGEEDDE
jgi:putative ubiquitin-RnfH superfamily antitoxin RatB of RatAB toxin-antitoxin module